MIHHCFFSAFTVLVILTLVRTGHCTVSPEEFVNMDYSGQYRGPWSVLPVPDPLRPWRSKRWPGHTYGELSTGNGTIVTRLRNVFNTSAPDPVTPEGFSLVYGHMSVRNGQWISSSGADLDIWGVTQINSTFTVAIFVPTSYPFPSFNVSQVYSRLDEYGLNETIFDSFFDSYDGGGLFRDFSLIPFCPGTISMNMTINETSNPVRLLGMEGYTRSWECPAFEFEFSTTPYVFPISQLEKYLLIQGFASVLILYASAMYFAHLKSTPGAFRYLPVWFSALQLGLDFYVSFGHVFGSLYFSKRYANWLILVSYSQLVSLGIFSRIFVLTYHEQERDSRSIRMQSFLCIVLFTILPFLGFTDVIVFISYLFLAPLAFVMARVSHRKVIQPLYLGLLSIGRCGLIYCFWILPSNVIETEPDPSFGYLILVLLAAQLAALCFLRVTHKAVCVRSQGDYSVLQLPPNATFSEETCAVCMSALVESEAVVTRCGHHFHSQCLSRWLLEKGECPVCRAPLR